MDLKCLIKLLLEKGYIEEELINSVNDNTVSVRYKFEHIEIFKKIKNSEYDKNIIFIEIAQKILKLCKFWYKNICI